MTAGWHVLGAGALGGLLAWQLQRAGVNTELILRRAPETGRVRLEVASAAGRDSAMLAASCAADNGSIQSLLITTKAYDAAGAVASVAHRLRPDARLLLLVNGMGAAREIRDAIPGAALFCGTTTEGAWRRDALAITWAGRGVTRLGGGGLAQAPDWFAPWRGALADCRWEPQIERALWQKLAINCAINPLTAIHRCRNGALATEPALARECSALVNEIAAVATAAGHPDIGATLAAQVAQVIAGTADNRSSMLQDVLAGRPTEIDYINGYLVREAQRLAVPAPLNRALSRQLGARL